MSNSKARGTANLEDLSTDFNILNLVIENKIKYMVNTCYAVKVMAVDTDNLTVDVMPLVSNLDGEGNKIDAPTIYNIPYFRLGTKNIGIKVDPNIDDIGFIIIFKNDSTNLKKGDTATVLPNTSLNYTLNSAIYIGGFLMDEPENYIEIKEDNITINANKNIVINCQTAEINADDTVNINANKINLGEGASLALVNEKITEALNNHTHNYINTAGAPTPTTPPLVPFLSSQYTNSNIKESV